MAFYLDKNNTPTSHCLPGRKIRGSTGLRYFRSLIVGLGAFAQIFSFR
jgi:hypothetical protein